jgi:hypothetical protein
MEKRILSDSNKHSMAEGEGFEPPEPFRVQRFSRPPVSTAHPSLRGLRAYLDCTAKVALIPSDNAPEHNRFLQYLHLPHRPARTVGNPLKQRRPRPAPQASLLPEQAAAFVALRFKRKTTFCPRARRPVRRLHRACAHLRSCRPNVRQRRDSSCRRRRSRRPATRCCRRRSGLPTHPRD